MGSRAVGGPGQLSRGSRSRAEAGSRTVRPGLSPGTFHVVWPDRPRATVSVVIPFRDEARLLRTCVDSVTETTEDDRVELVLVDNGSTDLETLTLMERLETRPDIRILHDARPFNWARLSNDGAGAARGEVLIFLNNDIEAQAGRGGSPHCAVSARRPDVGAVGARLLYPDGRLQHCGIALGLDGAAGHPLSGLAPGRSGYLQMARVARECSAVTGACLATRSARSSRSSRVSTRVSASTSTMWTSACAAGSPGSVRSTNLQPSSCTTNRRAEGTAGGVGDVVRFLDRWEHLIREGDPYLNPHRDEGDPSCRLASTDEVEQWDRWYSTVRAQ